MTIIVPIADAPFFRDLARTYAEGRPITPPKERLGRTPTAAQIRLAKYWGTKAGLPLPDYLETHHLSLSGWIGYARTYYRHYSGNYSNDLDSPDMVFDVTGLDE